MTQKWVKIGNIGRVTSWGTAPVGTLALGASADVAVTLQRAMPGAAYGVASTVTGAATLLANVTVIGIVSRTATTVTVRVRATGALATGATVEVVAIA